MDFDLKYPKSLRPVRFEPPHEEPEYEPGIRWTGRVYPCGVCGKLTGFHLDRKDKLPSGPCCSDDCKIIALGNEANEDPDFIFPRSDSSVVERLHDSQEVVGSIPTPSTTIWEQVLLHMLEDSINGSE